jgi:hypothetical protein
MKTRKPVDQRLDRAIDEWCDVGGGMRKLLMAYAIAIIAIPAIAADTNDPSSYVCVPDYATGFRLDRSGKWEPSQFSVQGKKFLLARKDARWFWTAVGPTDAKPEPCGTFTDYGFTECKDSEGEVLFNRKTLRFQLVRPYGYVTSDVATDKEMNAPPYYIIGRCAAQ